MEEFHRALKQLTGVEACQCCKAQIQDNHIACALLVWSQLKELPTRRAKGLSGQAWDAISLLNCAAQASICSDLACISPDFKGSLTKAIFLLDLKVDNRTNLTKALST